MEKWQELCHFKFINVNNVTNVPYYSHTCVTKIVYSCHDFHGNQTLDTYFNSISNLKQNKFATHKNNATGNN